MFGSEEHPEAREILDSYDAIKARNQDAGARATPLAPDRCYGRATETERLVGILGASSPAAIAVLGPPGIGKTTLTRQVAVSEPVVARFGQHRYFVELETANDATRVRDAITHALGFDSATTNFHTVLKHLRNAPTLLVLDNLETPWEQDMKAVENCLKQLTVLPNLSLLVSMRGTEPPVSPAFSHRMLLDVLSLDDARNIFLSIAPNISENDAFLRSFQEELGGVPLAVELVAYRAASQENLKELWEEWQVRGLDLMKNPNLPEERLTSLTRSIDLSLRSPRLHAEGQMLLSMLGLLPAGVTREDRVALLRADAYPAQHQIVSIGLGILKEDVVKLLPPIRKFIHTMLPPSTEAVHRLLMYCLTKWANLMDQEKIYEEKLNREYLDYPAPFGSAVCNLESVAVARLDLNLSDDIVIKTDDDVSFTFESLPDKMPILFEPRTRRSPNEITIAIRIMEVHTIISILPVRRRLGMAWVFPTLH